MGTYNGLCEKLLPSYTSHRNIVNLGFHYRSKLCEALGCAEKHSWTANCL